MKKLIVIIVLVVLMGVLLTAAVPAPAPDQILQGKLQWQRNNICGVSDYVPTEAMTKVHLMGKFTPTQGLFVGCKIVATGTYFHSGQCDYFNVSTYKISCPTSPLIEVGH